MFPVRCVGPCSKRRIIDDERASVSVLGLARRKGMAVDNVRMNEKKLDIWARSYSPGEELMAGCSGSGSFGGCLGILHCSPTRDLLRGKAAGW